VDLAGAVAGAAVVAVVAEDEDAAGAVSTRDPLIPWWRSVVSCGRAKATWFALGSGRRFRTSTRLCTCKTRPKSAALKKYWAQSLT